MDQTGDKLPRISSFSRSLSLLIIFPSVFLWSFCFAQNTALAEKPLSSSLRAAQGQAIILTSLSNMPGCFGGIELQLNISLLSIGLAKGIRYERVGRQDENSLHGVHSHGALQWRPLQLLPWKIYRYLDLHGDFGYVAGSLWSKRRLRTGLYFGGGLDVGIPLVRSLSKEKGKDGWPTESGGIFQLVLSANYRYYVLNRPEEVPSHDFLLGIGIRGTL